MKAVWIALDRDPWGHSITRLIKDLPAPEQDPRFEKRRFPSISCTSRPATPTPWPA